MRLVDRRTYRGKHPAHVKGFVNDRTILQIDSKFGWVRYEGPNLRSKICPVGEFERWASHDVTQQLPAGCYQEWGEFLAQKQVAKKNTKLGIG